jgi:hypothetical protein
VLTCGDVVVRGLASRRNCVRGNTSLHGVRQTASVPIESGHHDLGTDDQRLPALLLSVVISN